MTTARRISSRKLAVALTLVGLTLSTSACSGLSHQQQRALTGGAIGAAGGAALAAMTGGAVGTGALIGGAGGAVVGALTGNGRH